MPWETLPARMSKRSNDPAISVQKNFRVSWNRGTQAALGDPEFVELLLDKAAKRLGIRRSRKTETSFVVRKSAAQDSWGVSAEGPLKAAGLSVASCHRRYAVIEGDIVIIDITELF